MLDARRREPQDFHGISQDTQGILVGRLNTIKFLVKQCFWIEISFEKLDNHFHPQESELFR